MKAFGLAMASSTVVSVLFLLALISSAFALSWRDLEGTIAFATVGRAHYAFDVYSLPLPLSSAGHLLERKLTDGDSVNYNGHFVTRSAKQAVLEALKDRSGWPGGGAAGAGDVLAYVSEREGRPDLFFNIFSQEAQAGLEAFSFEAISKTEGKLEASGFLRDRPHVTGSHIVYASTQKPRLSSRQSWTAVYSTHLHSGLTTRLTPPGIADFSPAVSPSGKWIIVASDQNHGWTGEIHDLHTDLYIFNALDGSDRRLLIQHGGWPSWSDEYTVFFHRQAAEDGWWSIYKATLSDSWEILTCERVTPPGIHAFTPAASPTGEWIAVATRRPESEYRHIEIFHLESKTFQKVTHPIAPTKNHYNPFISSDSKHLGYHKCRGGTYDQLPSSLEIDLLQPSLFSYGRDLAQRDSAFTIPRLEYIQSPLPQMSLLRVDGTFPSFSPDGSLIAYIPNLSSPGVYVMQLDGSGSRKIFTGRAFGTAWDRKREGIVYTSTGKTFATEQTTVHIVSIFNVHKIAQGQDVPLSSKVLTNEGTGNNAFPSPSPDGRFVVFRSGRSGNKNLYIMDAMLGEKGGLWRLTEGPWTDTMCSWSPDGQWIAFSSDRDNPGGGSFAVYMVHPNGTGLHKTLNSSIAGRVNHPTFSPDSKTLLFTTDYAGVSAEPISTPHQYQPYGEIFLSKLDGSELLRLTHNAYEDGTPSWGGKYIGSSNLSEEGEAVGCLFDDSRWLKGSGNSLIRLSC